MSKEKNEIIKKFKYKIHLLKKYDKHYHDKDSPLVSDQEYDYLKKEVIDLEKSYKYLKNFYSVLNNVGFSPSNKPASFRAFLYCTFILLNVDSDHLAISSTLDANSSNLI